MSFLTTLMTKPWTAEQRGDKGAGSGSIFAATSQKVGLIILLIVLSALFLLFISGYRMRMGFEDWQPLPDPNLLWVTTGLLLLASIAFQWAHHCASQVQLRGVKKGLLGAGFFAFLFLMGQLMAWQQMSGLGYILKVNPANSFFYLITGLHGVHVLGGLFAWAFISFKLWQGVALNKLALSIQLCAIYWHYLLVVWLVLFYLLSST